jgi:hypothetical protein
MNTSHSPFISSSKTMLLSSIDGAARGELSAMLQDEAASYLFLLGMTEKRT